MTTVDTATHAETLQRYKDEFLAKTGKTEATTREIATWSVATGRWTAPADLLFQRCREDFAAAMREEQIRDDAGRPIRANQVARVVKEGKQQYL